jgi:hypothetical protein
MNKPTIEAFKEIARWAIFLLLGWVIAETLKQINLVTETYAMKVWIFTYTIPVRMIVQTLLTLAGRAIDKYIFTKNKEIIEARSSILNAVPKGLLWF